MFLSPPHDKSLNSQLTCELIIDNQSLYTITQLLPKKKNTQLLNI